MALLHLRLLLQEQTNATGAAFALSVSYLTQRSSRHVSFFDALTIVATGEKEDGSS